MVKAVVVVIVVVVAVAAAAGWAVMLASMFVARLLRIMRRSTFVIGGISLLLPVVGRVGVQVFSFFPRLDGNFVSFPCFYLCLGEDGWRCV